MSSQLQLFSPQLKFTRLLLKILSNLINSQSNLSFPSAKRKKIRCRVQLFFPEAILSQSLKWNTCKSDNLALPFASLIFSFRANDMRKSSEIAWDHVFPNISMVDYASLFSIFCLTVGRYTCPFFLADVRWIHVKAWVGAKDLGRWLLSLASVFPKKWDFQVQWNFFSRLWFENFRIWDLKWIPYFPSIFAKNSSTPFPI